MATATKIPLASLTLSASTSSVTFSGISQSYTDLILIYSTQMGTPDTILLRVNSDTGTNYSQTLISGNGSAASSTRYTGNTYLVAGTGGSDSASPEWSTRITQLMSYSNTTTYKTLITRANKASAYTTADVQLWRSTSAITSITVVPYSNTFASGSTFNLYGIL